MPSLNLLNVSEMEKQSTPVLLVASLPAMVSTYLEKYVL